MWEISFSVAKESLVSAAVEPKSSAKLTTELPFLLMGHSETGRDHLFGDLRGNGNQDCYGRRETSDGIILAVADGCGEKADSATGARAAIRIALNSCEKQLANGCRLSPEEFCEAIETDLLDRIKSAALPLTKSGSDEELMRVLDASYLFTLLVGVITPTWTAVIACGDGVFAVNEKPQILRPRRANQPDYISYRLWPSIGNGFDEVKMRVVYKGDTESLRSLLLATDGITPILKKKSTGEISVSSLITKAPDLDPGKLAKQFRDLAADRYEIATRQEGDGLVVFIRDTPGKLHDDCTFVEAIRSEMPLPTHWLALRQQTNWKGLPAGDSTDQGSNASDHEETAEEPEAVEKPVSTIEPEPEIVDETDTKTPPEHLITRLLKFWRWFG
jgi:hypothetical protein